MSKEEKNLQDGLFGEIAEHFDWWSNNALCAGALKAINQAIKQELHLFLSFGWIARKFKGAQVSTTSNADYHQILLGRESQSHYTRYPQRNDF